VIAEPFTADPALPGLEAAGDPDSMLRHFGEHLRPAGETAYEIRDCRLSRVRYRRGERCVLQYILNLSHPVTGAERAQWVTGVIIVGCPRSGTTLLRGMVNAHPLVGHPVRTPPSRKGEWTQRRHLAPHWVCAERARQPPGERQDR
jgi:hypothetical protein